MYLASRVKGMRFIPLGTTCEVDFGTLWELTLVYT